MFALNILVDSTEVFGDNEVQRHRLAIYIHIYTVHTRTEQFASMLSTTNIRKKELTDEELADIQECFDLFDTKRCGSIDYHEFKIALRALGFTLSKNEIVGLVREYDRSGR